MRAFTICAVVVLLGLQSPVWTQTQDEAKAIVGKAIKAMGVDKEPEGSQGLRIKSKGTVEIMGMSLNFSQSVTIRYPDQFKDAMELEINNMNIPINTVFDGKKGWVEVNGKVMKLEDNIISELKDVADVIKISRLKPLLKKPFELAVIGEVQVEEKPALGIRVSREGAKDINLFFDKKSGLMTKLDRQAIDAASGKEVQEERIIRSYQDKDGHKVPLRVGIQRDGKKYVEVEILEISNLDNVDAGEFDMPK